MIIQIHYINDITFVKWYHVFTNNFSVVKSETYVLMGDILHNPASGRGHQSYFYLRASSDSHSVKVH